MLLSWRVAVSEQGFAPRLGLQAFDTEPSRPIFSIAKPRAELAITRLLMQAEKHTTHTEDCKTEQYLCTWHMRKV